MALGNRSAEEVSLGIQRYCGVPSGWGAESVNQEIAAAIGENFSNDVVLVLDAIVGCLAEGVGDQVREVLDPNHKLKQSFGRSF